MRLQIVLTNVFNNNTLSNSAIRIVKSTSFGDYSTKYASYCVSVDDFSMLKLAGVYSLLTPNSTISVVVAGTTIATTPRRFFDDDKANFVGFYTAVIDMTKGNVTSGQIDWVDSCTASGGCNFDSAQGCIDDQDCSYPVDDASIALVDREPRVYIGFKGTDAKSRPLKSEGSMPSKFRQYAFGNYFNSLAGYVSNKINETLGR